MSEANTYIPGGIWLANITFHSEDIYNYDNYRLEVEITNTDNVEFDISTCTFSEVQILTSTDYKCSLIRGKTNHLQIAILKKIDKNNVPDDFAISLGITFQIKIKNTIHNLPNSQMTVIPYIRAMNSYQILSAYNFTVYLSLTPVNYFDTGGI